MTPVMLAMVVPLLAARASVGDELSTCVTQSVRSPRKIIVPLGDDPQIPPGVTIAKGETLCLAGAVDHRDQLWVHMADREHGEPAILLVRLTTDGHAVALHVRGPSDRWVRLAAAAHLENIADPDRSPAGAPPGRGRDTYLPDDGPGPWLLFRITVFGANPPPRVRSPVPMPSPEGRIAAFDFKFAAGVRRLGLGAFDASLRASGYTPFAHELPRLGGALQVGWKRWRFLMDVGATWATARARDGDGVIHAEYDEFHVDAGYDFLRWRGLSGFALAGFGFGTFTIDPRGPGWTALGPIASALGNPDTLALDLTSLQLQTGFEETIPVGRITDTSACGLTLSVQGGYVLALGRPTDWFAPGQTGTATGPPVDVGGTWVSFGIAFSMYGIGPGGIGAH